MQDLVAEYQQYQDATYVVTLIVNDIIIDRYLCNRVEEEGEYEEEAAAEEE